MSVFIDSRLIGKSIKHLRLSKNWTQEDLADRSFYSVRNIRRIENDGTGSIDVVNTFAGIFEVSAIDILNGDVFCLSLSIIIVVFVIFVVVNFVIRKDIFLFSYLTKFFFGINRFIGIRVFFVAR